MSRVLFLGCGVTIVAVVPIWAVEALVTDANDALHDCISIVAIDVNRFTNLVAFIADGMMLHVACWLVLRIRSGAEHFEAVTRVMTVLAA